METDGTIFHRLANTVTLRDILRPFAFVWDVDLDGNEERDLLARYLGICGALSRNPVLLTARYMMDTPMQEGDSQPFGVYFPEEAIAACCADGKIDLDRLADEENQGHSLDDGICHRTHEVSPRCVAAANTTLLDFVRNLSTEYHYCTLVLDGNCWSGAVTVDDLMSPPARMCFLAMALELENAAADLCRLFSTECIASLPQQRKQKAVEAFQQKFGAGSKILKVFRRYDRPRLYSRGKGERDQLQASIASRLIDSTNLTDKARMLCKCKLSIDLSNTAIRSVFGRAERLRNHCAHPGLDSASLPFDSFADFAKLVTEAIEITRVLQESLTMEFRARNITGPPRGVEDVRFYGGVEISDWRFPIIVATASKEPGKDTISEFFLLIKDKIGAVQFINGQTVQGPPPPDACLTDEEETMERCDQAVRRAKNAVWSLHADGNGKLGAQSLKSRDELDRRLKRLEARDVFRATYHNPGGKESLRAMSDATCCNQLKALVKNGTALGRR